MVSQKKEDKITEDLIDRYSQKIRELKSAMSLQRKENEYNDMLIPEAHLRNIQSKIDWALQTRKIEDFQKVETQLRMVEDEIKYASAEKHVDYKKDVNKLIKGDSEQKEGFQAQNVAGQVQSAQEESYAAQKFAEESMQKKKEERRKKMEEEFAKVPSPDKHFYLSCGYQLVSINDFIEKLPKIPDDCFAFHAAEEENHFSKWISGVFEDAELAKKIKGVRNKQQMLKILESAKRGE